MPTLPDFRLETYFAKWEFTAKYRPAGHSIRCSDFETARVSSGWSPVSRPESQNRDNTEGFAVPLYNSRQTLAR